MKKSSLQKVEVKKIKSKLGPDVQKFDWSGCFTDWEAKEYWERNFNCTIFYLLFWTIHSSGLETVIYWWNKSNKMQQNIVITEAIC